MALPAEKAAVPGAPAALPTEAPAELPAVVPGAPAATEAPAELPAVVPSDRTAGPEKTASSVWLRRHPASFSVWPWQSRDLASGLAWSLSEQYRRQGLQP